MVDSHSNCPQPCHEWCGEIAGKFHRCERLSGVSDAAGREAAIQRIANERIDYQTRSAALSKKVDGLAKAAATMLELIESGEYDELQGSEPFTKMRALVPTKKNSAND